MAAEEDDDDMIGGASTSDRKPRPNAKKRGKKDDTDVSETSQTVAAGQLRAFIERVERLEEEKATIAADIKDVYAEMKGTGFDTKAVRKIIAMRKQDEAERQEAESILELYMSALGMI